MRDGSARRFCSSESALGQNSTTEHDFSKLCYFYDKI
jgi:hypothetical protein